MVSFHIYSRQARQQAMKYHHSGQKQHGKQARRQWRVAGKDQDNGLELAMQKPLEKYQRRQQQHEPKKAFKLHAFPSHA